MMKGQVVALAIAFCMLFAGFVAILPGANAAEPVDSEDPDLVMWAQDYETGPEVDVDTSSDLRLDPANALGPADAVQGSEVDANKLFYALASHEWTNFTFEDRFMNVDGEPDIQFTEVTWGSTWHAEATLVYLTDATVWDEGEMVPYEPADGEEDGYFAGIAWNKMGLNGISADDRLEIADGYLPDGVERSFESNELRQEENFLITDFHLPDEVVCASGIKLIDITADVYDEGPGSSTYDGATDGYDLDAIRTYRCILGGDDSATGMGERIVDRGTWFMFNMYDPDDPEDSSWDIQAGNPDDGINTIGSFWVEYDEDDECYRVYYEMDSAEMNGYSYDIVVMEEHLSISEDTFKSDKPGKSTSPGQLDNADFGECFEADGAFYIFAHFEVMYV